MRIEGLNNEQVRMLDTIWQLDSIAEYFEWKADQSPRRQRMAEVLVYMLGLAAIDEEIDAMDSYPDAEKIIEKIQNSA